MSRRPGIGVFPTGVGMFLVFAGILGVVACLPHGRGDVSVGRVHPGLVPQSSPRAWGCFLFGVPATGLSRVFPTDVGMFPRSMITSPNWSSFPRERGDVFDSANCGSFDCQVLPWDKKSFWCFVKGE